jgi:hypothetical protein
VSALKILPVCLLCVCVCLSLPARVRLSVCLRMRGRASDPKLATFQTTEHRNYRIPSSVTRTQTKYRPVVRLGEASAYVRQRAKIIYPCPGLGIAAFFSGSATREPRPPRLVSTMSIQPRAFPFSLYQQVYSYAEIYGDILAIDLIYLTATI